MADEIVGKMMKLGWRVKYGLKMTCGKKQLRAQLQFVLLPNRAGAGLFGWSYKVVVICAEFSDWVESVRLTVGDLEHNSRIRRLYDGGAARKAWTVVDIECIETKTAAAAAKS